LVKPSRFTATPRPQSSALPRVLGPTDQRPLDTWSVSATAPPNSTSLPRSATFATTSSAVLRSQHYRSRRLEAGAIVSLNPFDVVGRFMLGGFLIRVEVSPDLAAIRASRAFFQNGKSETSLRFQFLSLPF